MIDERRLMILRLLVVGAFAGLAVLAITTLGSDASTDGTAGPLEDRTAALDEAAPDFRLAGLDGVVTRLADLEGRPVVLNFWATWCGPCKEEMPLLEAAYRRANGSLHVLAINYREPDDLASGFRDEIGLTLPVLLDLSGAVGDQYGVRGLPVTYFIDAAGIVRGVRIGSLTEELLNTQLAELGVS
jgi:thiol-disulfide isomerase/thioredoxin